MAFITELRKLKFLTFYVDSTNKKVQKLVSIGYIEKKILKVVSMY